MSQASNPEPAAESRQAPADVAQSLFWDDARAGLKVLCAGLIVLLVGELSVRFHAHEFLSGAVRIVGGLLCLAGLGICTAMPRETGARGLTLATAGCAALALLGMLINLFYPYDP